MFSVKNKKHNRAVFALTFFFFASIVFFAMPPQAHAFFGWLADTAIDTTLYPFKALLYYGVFVPLGFFTSVAITLFEWAINPNYISGPGGLLNRESVYTTWKFIRDFFNLFFILVLLYTAFTIIFQVAKDYKKTLLSLVLAALFVNFSFPITRVIIDVTNVPMYYFVNQMGADKDGKGILGQFLSASQLKDILIPPDKSLGDMSITYLLMAIVFLFIFTMTLLVLAILLVVRLVALVILLIFSSVGFAASVIPGLRKYSDMWWEHLAKYTLFGPASMLMLLVATRFFAEIKEGDVPVQFFQSAATNATQDATGNIAAMAMFSVPIIMMWFAISLSTSFSVVGAGAVVGLGKSVLAKTGKTVAYRNPFSNAARGLGRGVKDAAHDGKIAGFDYGSTRFGKFVTGKWIASPSKLEAGMQGLVTGKGKGWTSQRDILHQEQVNKQVKENKDKQVNRSSLLQSLESTDDVTRQAAALSLAENGEIRSAEDLTKALNALASGLDKQGKPMYTESATDMTLRVIDKAKDGATVGIKQEEYEKIISNPAFLVKDKNGKPLPEKDGKPVYVSAVETLNSKLKKDGQINTRVNYEIKRRGDTTEGRKAVYDDIFGKMSAEDLAKQNDIYTDEKFQQYVLTEMNEKKIQEVLKKATEKSSDKIQKGWVAINNKALAQASPSIIEVTGSGRAPRSHTVIPNA